MERTRVLAVEDNPGDARLLEWHLSRPGCEAFEMTLVERLADARRLLAAHRYDGVLLDLSLPDSTGLNTVRAVRAAAGMTPIVIMTGLDDEETALAALRGGAQDYLVKGRFESRDLVRALRYAIERERTEQTLRQTKEALEAIIAASPAAVLSLDTDGRVLSWNDSATAIFGWTAEEAIGSQLFFVDSDVETEFAYLLRRAMAGEALTDVELRRRRKDGELIDVSLSSGVTRGPDGSTSGVVAVVADITERKRAEETVRQLGRRNELILAAAGEGIIGLDAEGRCTFVNPAAARILGFAPSEMVGRGLHGLTHHTWPDGRPYPREECPIYRAFLDGTVHRGADEHFWTKDGRLVPVEYESRPVRDGDVLAGAVVSFSDITERKKAEQTLRESEKKYRQVIESIGEGVGVADPEDRFVFANCAAGAIFGVEPERLVGQRLDAFVTPESWTRVREQTARRSKGESGSYEIEVVRPDGSRRTVLITATPQYDKAGAFTGAFGVFRDVTDLKRAEAEIAQKNAKLAELNEFKNQLLGMAAHDLRNPLSVIYAASSFLADPGAQSLPAEKRQDFLFRIKNNSEFMAQLIEDLLDFAAIESGKVSLSQKTTDLAEFVRRNVEQNRMLAERKGITVSYETGETLPPVAVDRFRIDRVLNNLIGNAVKFSATGSPVTVATRRNNGSIVVSVRDLGPGIPAEELDRLFKPFSRTSVKSTGGERGTGLGLAISKETVEAHGGRVWVESVVGRGSTFSFSLPVRDAV